MFTVQLKQLDYSQGGVHLVDHIDLTLPTKERVILIGRNGEGKSTLLRLLAGEIQPDSGTIHFNRGVRTALLSQPLLSANPQTVLEYIEDGLADISELWQYQPKIEQLLSDFKLDSEARLQDLSGGGLRKAALIKALVQEPECLMLDEPTNHLDIDSIALLEQHLLNYPHTLIMVTHDRALMRSLATQIIELDRGHIYTYPSNYDLYLSRKAHQLEVEEKQNALFDKKLSQEEAWIRQGIKARRTRNEGRVRNLERLREERKQRRDIKGNPSFQINSTDAQSKLLIEATNICKQFENKTVTDHFSIRLMKGEKLAIIGPNGAGKTTLVQMLTGQLQPDSGKVKLAQNLQLVYFDQKRMQIDPTKTLIENVAEGSDTLDINGKRQHVISYLGDFLFSPMKARTKASMLSGGETNRLLLAKIFSKPANLLVLDEPTNDLDVESLELLESILQTFDGTVILISHDREFIDNIATSTLSVRANGVITHHAGGYTDYLERESRRAEPVQPAAVTAPSPAPVKKSGKQSESRIIKQIEKLETEIEQYHALMAEEGFYQKPQAEQTPIMEKLKKLEAQLEEAYASL